MNDDKKSKKNTDAENQILQLTAQNSELVEALKRERADVINVRRHHDGQIASLKSHVKADVIEDLLPVIDNFERALDHVPKDLEGSDFVKGVQAVVKQFESTIGNIGVQRIRTVGEVFDPNLHEAVSMEDGEGVKEIISEELQAGYQLGDTIIRHAMVRVKKQ